MRTVLLVLGLTVSSLTLAAGRAPTQAELEQLDIIPQSWIFQG
ncbi:MAG: hypothetical protein VX793_13135 [Pseudomonadota bacterium]|nr:hypothetical protein [Pseudomonadota bacterium]